MQLLKLLKFQSTIEYNIFTNIQSFLYYIIKVTCSSIQSNLVIRFSRMLQWIWKIPGGISFVKKKKKRKKEKKNEKFRVVVNPCQWKMSQCKKENHIELVWISLQFDEFVSIQCNAWLLFKCRREIVKRDRLIDDFFYYFQYIIFVTWCMNGKRILFF